MKFLNKNPTFPISGAVAHQGKVLETVLTAISPGKSEPVKGGAGAEMKEIFRQLDKVLAQAGLDKTSVCSARLYLEHVLCDIDEVNEEY